jgi:hypothetical protein
MATDIIPKPRSRRRFRISLGGVFYYLSIFLLIFSFLAYYGLDFLDQRYRVQLDNLKTKISGTEDKNTKIMESRILSSKRKIEAFDGIFSSYPKSSRFFEMISELCHPKVYFPEVNLAVEELSASLGGHTENFASLKEQVLIFKNDSRIKNFVLSDINLGQNGGVDFKLSLYFNDEFFK